MQEEKKSGLLSLEAVRSVFSQLSDKNKEEIFKELFGSLGEATQGRIMKEIMPVYDGLRDEDFSFHYLMLDISLSDYITSLDSLNEIYNSLVREGIDVNETTIVFFIKQGKPITEKQMTVRLEEPRLFNGEFNNESMWVVSEDFDEVYPQMINKLSGLEKPLSGICFKTRWNDTHDSMPLNLHTYFIGALLEMFRSRFSSKTLLHEPELKVLYDRILDLYRNY